jgi:hypothetical protein
MSLFSLPLSLGLAGAGSLASALGGAFGASNANREARKARDFGIAEGARGMYGAAGALYGGSGGLLPTLMRLAPGYRERFVNEVFGLTDQNTGLNLESLSAADLAGYLQGRGIGDSGQAGYLPQMRALADTVSARQTGNLRYHDATTQQLRQIAEQFGRGQDERIDRDAARALAAANQQTSARLKAAGLGNTSAIANQTSANVRNIMQDARDAKSLLDMERIDRLLGLLERRAGGRAALEEGNLSRDIALRADPLERELQVNLQALTPSAQGYTPAGISSLGTALTTAGNAAAMLGMLGLGSQSGSGGSGVAVPGYAGGMFRTAGGPLSTPTLLDPNRRFQLLG